eukprot:g15847.t1
MSNELGVEQYCEQHLQDNTCMAIKAAIGASLELKKRGVKPRFANFALTRWGKYPSWTKGSVTVTEPDAPNKPAVAQVHDAAGVVGYGVCNILRTILTHSVNQYGTGTCGSVAPLAALSWSAPAQAIKMSLRLFWVGTMHKSFKVCDNIYDLQPGLVPLSNDKVNVAVGRKMKHMQPTKIEHLCQEKCDQLEAVKEGKSFPMMSAGLTAMWTYASLSHLKEAPKGCPAPTDSVLQVMYPDMIQEEPTKMEAFFDKEPTSMQWYLGPDGRKMLYHDDPAHDDNLNLCKQFISPNCVRVKDVPVVDYQENEDQLNKACAALKAGGIHAIEQVPRGDEAFLSDNSDIAETLSTGMALRDRCAIVEDAGRMRRRHLLCPLCCSGDDEVAAAAAELLDQLAEPDATFSGGRRTFHYRGIEVEYWELDEDPCDLLFGYGAWPVLDWNVDQGVEQFDIIVASDVLLCCCGAPEALPAVLSRRLKLDGKALLLNVLRGARAQLIAISLLQRHGFLVSIFAVASLDMDQLKSAARRVKERHVSLRVKNLRFLASLNEEALRSQARLCALLERSEGALLPEISVSQKGVIFDLVAQLLDFALAEASKHASNLSTAPALKLASLIDTQLLCQVVTGPFRRRLLALSRKRDGGYATASRSRSLSGGVKAMSCGEVFSVAASSSELSLQAWEDASNACCERIALCIQQAVASKAGETRGAEPS